MLYVLNSLQINYCGVSPNSLKGKLWPPTMIGVYCSSKPEGSPSKDKEDLEEPPTPGLSLLMVMKEFIFEYHFKSRLQESSYLPYFLIEKLVPFYFPCVSWITSYVLQLLNNTLQASGICDLSDELSDNSDELVKHSRACGHSGILCSERVERQTFFLPLKQASSTHPIPCGPAKGLTSQSLQQRVKFCRRKAQQIKDLWFNKYLLTHSSKSKSLLHVACLE